MTKNVFSYNCTSKQDIIRLLLQQLCLPLKIRISLTISERVKYRNKYLLDIFSDGVPMV